MRFSILNIVEENVGSAVVVENDDADQDFLIVLDSIEANAAQLLKVLCDPIVSFLLLLMLGHNQFGVDISRGSQVQLRVEIPVVVLQVYVRLVSRVC